MMLINKYFAKSLFLHLVIFLCFALTYQSANTKPQNLSKPVANKSKLEEQVVNATLIDKKNIDKALARQKYAKQKQEQEIVNKQQQLAKLEREASQTKQQAKNLQSQILSSNQELDRVKQKKKEVESNLKNQQQQIEQQKLAFEKDKQIRLKSIEKLRQQAKQIDSENQEKIRYQIEQEQQELSKLTYVNEEVNKHLNELERLFNNRTMQTTFEEGLVTEIKLHLRPDGTLIRPEIIKSSGNVAYDEWQVAQIWKQAEPVLIEMPEDHELVREIILRIQEYTFGFKNSYS